MIVFDGAVDVPDIGLYCPKIISGLPVIIMVFVVQLAGVVADRTWCSILDMRMAAIIDS